MMSPKLNCNENIDYVLVSILNHAKYSYLAAFTVAVTAVASAAARRLLVMNHLGVVVVHISPNTLQTIGYSSLYLYSSSHLDLSVSHWRALSPKHKMKT